MTYGETGAAGAHTPERREPRLSVALSRLQGNLDVTNRC